MAGRSLKAGLTEHPIETASGLDAHIVPLHEHPGASTRVITGRIGELLTEILIQSSASGYIQDLHTTADTEDWESYEIGGADRGQLDGVAEVKNVEVVDRCSLPIVRGINIFPAGEKQSIDTGDESCRVRRWHVVGHIDRKTAGADDRLRVRSGQPFIRIRRRLAARFVERPAAERDGNDRRPVLYGFTHVLRLGIPTLRGTPFEC
jgi:hypothetical protein